MGNKIVFLMVLLSLTACKPDKKTEHDHEKDNRLEEQQNNQGENADNSSNGETVVSDEVVTKLEKDAGIIELGPVKGATVSIQALDGYSLYSTITGDNGYFKVDIDLLKAAIEKYGADIKYLKIVSTGGIDTDPNDDGIIIESEQVEVKGNVEGIVPLSSLYESKDFRINFISTALTELLSGQDKISEEQIAYIIQRLGVPDINNDGDVNLNDLTNYKMSEHNSIAETTLREGYLEFIHNGNKEAKKLFVENLKYEVGFSQPSYVNSGGFYTVKLAKNNASNTLYYGVLTPTSRPSYVAYNGEDITINYGDAIFFQECSEDGGCYQLQKLFFYENSVFEDFDREPVVADKYEEYLKLTQDIQKEKENLNSSQAELSELESDITGFDGQVADLETAFESI